MDINKITYLKNYFDLISQKIKNSDIEFWYARDLQISLNYTQWRNFLDVIKKAKVTCKTSGGQINNHFADVSKMVEVGSDAVLEKG